MKVGFHSIVKHVFVHSVIFPLTDKFGHWICTNSISMLGPNVFLSFCGK